MGIRELRENAGMSRRQFCEYFGIPARTLQNWELYGSSPEGRKCPDYLIALIRYKLEKENLI